MFIYLELKETFAFVYLLRGINLLHICLVSSAVMLGIFILQGLEGKYLCSDFVEIGKDLGRPAENPSSQTLTEHYILFLFFLQALKVSTFGCMSAFSLIDYLSTD